MKLKIQKPLANSAIGLLGLSLSVAVPAQAENAQSVTQYGITWRFDKPTLVGQFVTGDYWVVGPVNIVSVEPSPTPSQEDTTSEAKSIYGATAMQTDNRLRNGSMIIAKPNANQGYDSRLKNYNPELSVKFPLALQPKQTLVSTISNSTLPVQVMHNALMWNSEKNSTLALKSAAVLTCLPEAPPADAFRPAYVGTQKKKYRAGNIQWERLPRLKPAGTVPNWEQFERYLERPWLDHMPSWLLQHLGPNENQVNYGREFSRITGIASLMLALDVPNERKQKLLYGLIQLGIDLEGLAAEGRAWNADGGHWNGRKWPILFTGLMLNEPKFQQTADATSFSEDQQTYYGIGAAGQKALYQIVLHTFPRQPHEEKRADAWDDSDKRAEAYRSVVSGAWPATALTIQLMKAKAIWNHDAFFDYNDRWMAVEDIYATNRGNIPRPKSEGRSFDPFVDAMWAAYRASVPKQTGARDNKKWEWNQGGNIRNGAMVPINTN
jgi:hypothetical protein